MSSSNLPAAVRITNTADLLALIPFVFGFWPESSLVLLAMHDHAGILTAVRVDLPATAGTVEPLHAALGRVAARVKPHTDGYLVLAGYGPAHQVEPTVNAAARCLRSAGMEVRVTLRVADGRFWLLDCDGPVCCPAEGTVFEPADSPVTAAAVYAGRVALPTRDTLAATLAPVTGPARDAMVAATVRACSYFTRLLEDAAPQAGSNPDGAPDTRAGHALPVTARTLLTHVHDSYRARQPVDNERAAKLTVLLDLPDMRDFAARRTSSEAWQIDMWTDLVRRSEPAFTSAPATLLTLCAMQAGHGALANIAIDRALACDPDNRLAQLLARAIAAGITPDAVTALLAR